MAPLLRVQYADQLWPTVAEWHDDCLVLIRIHYQPLYVQGNIADIFIALNGNDAYVCPGMLFVGCGMRSCV